MALANSSVGHGLSMEQPPALSISDAVVARLKILFIARILGIAPSNGMERVMLEYFQGAG